MRALVEVVCEAGIAAPSEEAASALIQAVMECEDVKGSVVLAFIDESTMTELNGRYRSTNESTDVLSFSESDDAEWLDVGDELGEVSSEKTGPDLGEVAICPGVVRRYAEEEGRVYGRQMAWTIIHGVLHLLGYDHESDAGEMRRREQVLLGELDRFAAALAQPGSY